MPELAQRNGFKSTRSGWPPARGKSRIEEHICFVIAPVVASIMKLVAPSTRSRSGRSRKPIVFYYRALASWSCPDTKIARESHTSPGGGGALNRAAQVGSGHIIRVAIGNEIANRLLLPGGVDDVTSPHLISTPVTKPTAAERAWPRRRVIALNSDCRTLPSNEASDIGFVSHRRGRSGRSVHDRRNDQHLPRSNIALPGNTPSSSAPAGEVRARSGNTAWSPVVKRGTRDHVDVTADCPPGTVKETVAEPAFIPFRISIETTLDEAAIVGPLRTHIRDAVVDNRRRFVHQLPKLSGNGSGKAGIARKQQITSVETKQRIEGSCLRGSLRDLEDRVGCAITGAGPRWRRTSRAP